MEVVGNHGRQGRSSLDFQDNRGMEVIGSKDKVTLPRSSVGGSEQWECRRESQREKEKDEIPTKEGTKHGSTLAHSWSVTGVQLEVGGLPYCMVQMCTVGCHCRGRWKEWYQVPGIVITMSTLLNDFSISYQIDPTEYSILPLF
jgi:hypothetical protein